MSIFYLASPYTGAKEVMLERFHAVKKASAALLTRRIWVYSPILHCHQLAEDHALPTDFDFWRDYNHAMIDVSTGLLILGIDGWQTSKGVTGEREYAAAKGLPISLVHPNHEYSIYALTEE